MVVRGKVLTPLYWAFPVGRTVGFLAQVARPRPCSKNDIKLSQINGEAIRRTVKHEDGKTRRPKRKTTMGCDGWPLLEWGVPRGAKPPLAYLALRSKDIISYHVYIRDHGYTILRAKCGNRFRIFDKNKTWKSFPRFLTRIKRRNRFAVLCCR